MHDFPRRFLPGNEAFAPLIRLKDMEGGWGLSWERQPRGRWTFAYMNPLIEKKHPCALRNVLAFLCLIWGSFLESQSPHARKKHKQDYGSGIGVEGLFIKTAWTMKVQKSLLLPKTKQQQRPMCSPKFRVS